MKLKDDKGTHWLPDIFGITYVSLKSYKPYGRRKSKKPEYHVLIGFARDTELYLSFSSKKKAQAAYDRLVKRLKEEY